MNALAGSLLFLTLVSATPSGPVLKPLAGTRADVAVILLGAAESGSLWTAAVAVPRPEGAVERLVPVDLWVEVDGSRLLPEDDDVEKLRLELHVYAFNADGELVASLARQVGVPVEEYGADVLAGGVKLASRLDLEPGSHQVRVLVRERRTQRFGLRILEVDVPLPGKPFVTPPLFDDVDGAWVTVHDAESPVYEKTPPSAFPILVGDRREHFTLHAEGDVRLRLLNLEGEEVAAPDFKRDEGQADFRMPQLEAGTYRLEAAGKHGRKAGLAVLVLGAEWDDPSLTWTTLRRLADDEDAQREILDLAAERRAANRVAAIADAYTGVLRTVASGAFDDALTELEGLERESVSHGKKRSKASAELSAAEQRLISRLRKQDPESLVPLLALHTAMHDRYLEGGEKDPFLVNPTRERIRDLANAYSESKNDLAQGLAALTLAELGRSLDGVGRPETARQLFEEARALDPGNASVLLYLAYWHERRSYYAEAVGLLRELLASEPGSQEGRLRLALCLRRMGEESEAAALLRQTIRETQRETSARQDWIVPVAFGELARLLLRRPEPDLDEIVRLLGTAVERFPDDQRLRVQWAYALERRGERRRATEVMSALPADRGEVSPRFRYSERPRSATEGPSIASTLRRHANARLPLLTAALAGVEE